MSYFMSVSEQAEEEARERYGMDYKGIVLNAAVSILSSVSATAVTSFLTTVPASQLPAVAAGIFLAQVLPKLVIEVHRAYIRNRAIREGYRAGLTAGDSWKDTRSRTVSSFIYAFEHSSYF